MIHPLRRIFVTGLIFSVTILMSTGRAASPEGDDVLRPTSGWLKWGPLIGGSWDMSMGSFRSTCNCEYSNGNGLGGQIGAYLEYHMSKTWSVGLDASFGFGSLLYKNVVTGPEYVDGGGYPIITQEQRADVTFTMVSGQVLARWNTGIPRLSAQGGVVVDYLLSPMFTDIQRILTPGYGYPNTGTDEERLIDGKLSSTYSVHKLQASLALGAGYEFSVASGFSLRPELMYVFPLTSLVSEYPDWKLSRLQLNVKILL